MTKRFLLFVSVPLAFAAGWIAHRPQSHTEPPQSERPFQAVFYGTGDEQTTITVERVVSHADRTAPNAADERTVGLLYLNPDGTTRYVTYSGRLAVPVTASRSP